MTFRTSESFYFLCIIGLPIILIVSSQLCINHFEYLPQWHCSISLNAFFHCLDFAAEFLPAGLYPTTKKCFSPPLYNRMKSQRYLVSHFLPKYLCFILILKTADKIITIMNQITFAFTLSLYDYIKPVIQYIMQLDICKYQTSSISLQGSRSLSRNLPFSMTPTF